MSEREQFEAWATKQGHALGYGGDGNYDIWVVARWWEAWQAARTQPAQVPTLTPDEINQMMEDGLFFEHPTKFVPEIAAALLKKMQGTSS